jgi:hypothetical protein
LAGRLARAYGPAQRWERDESSRTV